MAIPKLPLSGRRIPWGSAALVACLIGLPSARAHAQNAQNNGTAVSWSALLAGPGRPALEASLDQPFANPFDARRPGLAPKLVRTCSELLALADHSAAGTEVESRAFEAQRARCRVVKMLLAARPAKESFLDGFVIDDGVFDALPASMIPTSSSEEAKAFAKAAEGGANWRARDPKTKIVGVRGERVVAEGTDKHVNLTILGRGDVDGDGVLDVIVERVGTARDARWSFTEAFVLTRRKAGRRLDVIARLD